MRKCLEFKDNNVADIRLDQHGGKQKLFRVTYGKHVKDFLPYRLAAAELGACLMHAAACDGLLDNEGE